MGTRWEGILARATRDAIGDLVPLVLPLCSLVQPPIRVDLRTGSHPTVPGVWSLELTGINKSSLLLRTPGEAVRAFTLNLSTPIVDLVSRSAQFELALLAAQHLGEAIWVLHSDGLSQSASVILQGASVTNSEWTDSGSSEDYGVAALRGIRRCVPSVQDIDQFLDLWYQSDAAWVSWRLMESGHVLGAPRSLAVPEDRS